MLVWFMGRVVMFVCVGIGLCGWGTLDGPMLRDPESSKGFRVCRENERSLSQCDQVGSCLALYSIETAPVLQNC